jgi:hypothetical protein
MIIFDCLTGQLKFVKAPDNTNSFESLVDFGNHFVGDLILDMGERLVEESIVDLEFRI